MRITLSNVSQNNVSQLSALLGVTLDCRVTTTRYTLTDTFEARRVQGYKEVYDAYYSQMKIWDEEHIQKALAHVQSLPNPYERMTPEYYGFSKAQLEAENGTLRQPREVSRYALTAVCSVPSDPGLLFRLAHSIGKAYRNVEITID